MSINFVRQPDAITSGPACLKMVTGFYKRNISLEYLIKKCQIKDKGVTIHGLSEAADSLGFRTLGVKISFEKLYENVPLPCIVSWKKDHFLVVYKIKKDKIWVADPAMGLTKYSRNEFIKNWISTFNNEMQSGLVLIIEPTPNFYEIDNVEAEEIYNPDSNIEIISYPIISINEGIKQYLAKHPEKVHELNPRKFEELIADILHDLGFSVELTKATRDGGVDIYAYIRTAVCEFLLFVECKKWAPNNHVGIDVVQRLFGVQQSGQANKSMIITTSFFTEPAIKEAKRYNGLMELRDYNALKDWLLKYGNITRNKN
jgi:hypothetical protein